MGVIHSASRRRQVVVDRDDVHALAGQRIERGRHGRDQRFAFTGLQLGDAAVVDGGAADDLNVELTLADRALGRLTHQGERLHQQAIRANRPAGLEAAAPWACDFNSSSEHRSIESSRALTRSAITA